MKPPVLMLAVTALLWPLTAQAGGTLVVCDGESEPGTLDPMREFSEKNHTILQQIYDGLVRFNPDGRVIEPALAERWEKLEAPRYGMRFFLRKGVAFHNGEPFTAEAVKFSIERYVDPDIRFPAASFLSHIKVQVVDDYTVDLVTVYPDGLLLHRLAGFVLIVPPKYVRENKDGVLDLKPIGTGAFRYDTREPGKSIRLNANREYWMGPQYPKLHTLVFRFLLIQEQVDLLLKEEVDLVTELPGTLTRPVMESAVALVQKRETFWTIGALINNVPPSPLADLRVRRALNHAVDRADLIRYDVRGNGTILASLTMEGQEGHNPDLEPYPYDPAEANRLLDDAGVKRPLILRTHVRAESERAAKIIASHLKKVGVILDMEVFNDARVIETLNDPQEIWDFGIAGIPDPMCHSYFIQSVLLYSESPYALLRDEEFDRRLIEMVSQRDPMELEQRARELDKYVHDQALSLFTYQKIKTYGVRRHVRFTPYVSGMPYFFDVSIEPGVTDKLDPVLPSVR